MTNPWYRRLREHAAARPTATAWADDTRTLTYRECEAAVTERAADFTDMQGQGVNIQAAAPYVQWRDWLAAQAAGAVPVLFHATLSAEDTAALCRTHGIDGAADVPRPQGADFGILSSGSTGLPKLFWRRSPSWITFFPIQNPLFALDGDSRLFFHGSLSFTGNLNACASVFWDGGALITTARKRPDAWWQVIRRHRVNAIYLLPVKLRHLTHAADTPYPPLVSLFAGSQALDRALVETIRTLFPQATATLYYGAGELNFITYCSLDEWMTEPGIVGRPFAGVDVRIDPDGRIHVTTPYGVCGTEDETTLGDLGEWTESGMLRFLGRSDDVLNCAGHKCSLNEIESVLRRDPAVRDIAVFAVPDPLRGEIPVAAFVSDTADAREMRRIAQVLPPVERPRHWYRYDELPLTDCSKVDYRLLRRRHTDKKRR